MMTTNCEHIFVNYGVIEKCVNCGQVNMLTANGYAPICEHDDTIRLSDNEWRCNTCGTTLYIEKEA